MLDAVDRRILRIWQNTPDIGPGDLADKARVSAGQLARRQARLQDAGVIEAVEAVIDWSALGYAVEVSLRITLDKSVPGAFEDFMDAARDIPEVLAIQTFLGRVDVRLAVIARDMGHYQDIYRSRILACPHIADIEALMHVTRIKGEEALPV